MPIHTYTLYTTMEYWRKYNKMKQRKNTYNCNIAILQIIPTHNDDLNVFAAHASFTFAPKELLLRHFYTHICRQ